MLGGFERGMAELAGYRDSERIEAAPRDSVRGKSTDQLLPIARRAMMQMAGNLGEQGGANILEQLERGELPRGELKLVVMAGDVRVAMGVVRMLGGDK